MDNALTRIERWKPLNVVFMIPLLATAFYFAGFPIRWSGPHPAVAGQNQRQGCRLRPQREIETTFLKAAEQRMLDTGAGSLRHLGNSQGRNIWDFAPLSQLRVAISGDDKGVTEVQPILIMPANPADIDRLVTLSAFTTARYSTVSEHEVKDRIEQIIKFGSGHPHTTISFGQLDVTIQDSLGGFVVSIGTFDCPKQGSP